MYEPVTYFRSEDFREILEDILLQHSSAPFVLVIVPDVAQWAKEFNVVMMGNPIATAIPATQDLPARIVMKNEISKDEAEGVFGLLDYHGHSAEVRSLRPNSAQFGMHLVLHELAHLENNWGQEREQDCDNWAFDRLPIKR